MNHFERIQSVLRSVQSRVRRHSQNGQVTSKTILAWVEEGFQSLGVRRAGEGLFGSVVVHGPWAIKRMNTKVSDGALSYLRHAQRHHHGNPLLPKVKLCWSVGPFTFVVMERLWARTRQACSISEALKNSFKRRRFKAHQLSEKPFRSYRIKVNSVYETLKAVEDVLRHPNHLRKSWEDMHEGNILFRKSRGRFTPVLTDPIAH